MDVHSDVAATIEPQAEVVISDEVSEQGNSTATIQTASEPSEEDAPVVPTIQPSRRRQVTGSLLTKVLLLCLFVVVIVTVVGVFLATEIKQDSLATSAADSTLLGFFECCVYG
jgi:nitrate reductase NapE component